MKHVMLDLETMGTKPGCVIVSIGAVNFDLDTGKIGPKFYTSVSIDSCIGWGLLLEEPTVNWWKSQTSQAKAKWALNPTALSVALQDFSDFVQRNDITQVWGNSASFDCSILAACYNAVNKPLPWHYSQEKCYRTVKALFPGNFIKKDAAKSHDPIYDCEYQISILCNIWNKIHKGNRI